MRLDYILSRDLLFSDLMKNKNGLFLLFEAIPAIEQIGSLCFMGYGYIRNGRNSNDCSLYFGVKRKEVFFGFRS